MRFNLKGIAKTHKRLASGRVYDEGAAEAVRRLLSRVLTGAGRTPFNGRDSARVASLLLAQKVLLSTT